MNPALRFQEHLQQSLFLGEEGPAVERLVVKGPHERGEKHRLEEDASRCIFQGQLHIPDKTVKLVVVGPHECFHVVLCKGHAGCPD